MRARLDAPTPHGPRKHHGGWSGILVSHVSKNTPAHNIPIDVSHPVRTLSRFRNPCLWSQFSINLRGESPRQFRDSGVLPGAARPTAKSGVPELADSETWPTAQVLATTWDISRLSLPAQQKTPGENKVSPGARMAGTRPSSKLPKSDNLRSSSFQTARASRNGTVWPGGVSRTVFEIVRLRLAVPINRMSFCSGEL